MWAILAHPGHEEGFLDDGERFAPMRRLVGELARRPYAADLFAHRSLRSFVLTTAPTYPEAAGHDSLGIDYDPARGVFEVRYRERDSSPRRGPAGRLCDGSEVGGVVDLHALRLWLSGRVADA